MAANIKENRFWSRERVRQACINNELYTCGDCEEYEHMLDCVNKLYPNTENIYFIAKDIAEHSNDQAISNVMYILVNEAVITTFELEDEEVEEAND